MLINLLGKRKMSNTDKKNQEMSQQALYEQLEVRYGAGLAQEIVDQIKKTEDQDNKPEFMAVKPIIWSKSQIPWYSNDQHQKNILVDIILDIC